MRVVVKKFISLTDKFYLGNLFSINFHTRRLPLININQRYKSEINNYKIFIVKEEIVNLKYTLKNFKLTNKSKFLWFLRFSKAWIDLALIKILSSNANKSK